MNAEQLAQKFHETYERLAPTHGYETRKDSAVPWENVPEKNKKLMTAVCEEILKLMFPPPTSIADWDRDIGNGFNERGYPAGQGIYHDPMG